MKVCLLLLMFSTFTACVVSERRLDSGETADVPSRCSIRNFKTDGSIGVKWNAATRTLAYGRPDKAGSYKIFLSDESGGQERPLTYRTWSASSHQFPLDWYPTGKYLFAAVEKADHPRSHTDAIPGYGAYTDLWLITRDGKKAWKLVDLPNDYDHAITHGKISGSGTKLTWTERVKAPNLLSLNRFAGAYEFDVADFVESPTPHLEHIVPYKPCDCDQGGEVDGITDDGQVIAYYSTYVTHNLFASRIYTTDLRTGLTRELSHKSFSQAPNFTPDGRGIVYMSAEDAVIFPFQVQGADWWYVGRDGSDRHRLTFMNQWNSPHSVNQYRLAGAITFLSDHTFLGDVMTSPLGLHGKIVKVTCPSFSRAPQSGDARPRE